MVMKKKKERVNWLISISTHRSGDAQLGYVPTPASSEVPEMTDSKHPLIKGIVKLFNNSDYADVKIYIGQYGLPAHSVVLASQSPFFQKALKGNFQEGKDKQFRFEEGSMHAYWRVFEYMYTGEYAEEPTQVLDTLDDNELVKDIRVYIAAEFFMLDDLKQLALQKFRLKLENLWVSESFVACIREIYASTTESEEGLRSSVVAAAFTHQAELWQRQLFRDLISDGGDFVVDLVGKYTGGRHRFR
ncbi:BTB/POZ domain-containing protein [Xylaria digitata]|nr:BTB/POZ domain-containing protein [Xylaria digitata]